ncbi:MAG: DUF1338 domain-containing protein [Kofleriaceae bacterium]
MTTADLLAALWRDYTATTPQAARIHALLEARGERIVNDHVALRTYDEPAIGLAALGRIFEAHGWRAVDDYRFPDKHLRARYWRHPDAGLPKIFVSELERAALPADAQAAIAALLAQLPADFGARADLAWAGRPWQVTHATYRALLEVSEYAAWVAAFGLRVNHFTVDVGALTTFADLDALDDFLLASGFTLNEAGGRIKGTPADRLEQSSTMADEIEVEFAEGTFRVPSCYYEFARRYPLPSGELFHGFIPASANRLFESTDVRR